jgi:hypothetical protein
MDLDAIQPEEVKAIEIYGGTKEPINFLVTTWSGAGRCSSTGRRNDRSGPGTVYIKYVSIWTK